MSIKSIFGIKENKTPIFVTPDRQNPEQIETTSVKQAIETTALKVNFTPGTIPKAGYVINDIAGNCVGGDPGASLPYKSIVFGVFQNGTNPLDVTEIYNEVNGDINTTWNKTYDGVGSYRLIPPTNIFAGHTCCIMPQCSFLFNGDVVMMLFTSCYVNPTDGWIGFACTQLDSTPQDDGINGTFEVRIYD